MKAVFVYSDKTIVEVPFPKMMQVSVKVSRTLTVEPIIVIFEGRPTDEQLGSPSTCCQYTRWQHWCLRQTRTYIE